MNLDELKQFLSENNIKLYGATLAKDSERIDKVCLSDCAVAIGSEGKGLSDNMISICDKTVIIPMNQDCESLNAATAATVFMWESYRQRTML